MTQTSQDAADQGPAGGPELPPASGKRARARARDNAPARQRPVAQVAVDIPLAHLDRPFDYLVPERLAAAAVPGCRVRVRFAGQLVDGFVLARTDASDHRGRLSYLDRVVSPEPVLTPEIAGLARAVADRYAGTLADVLRLAIPPRHARTEATPSPPAAGPRPRPQRAPGRGTRPGTPSWPRWPRAAGSGPPGRRCPGRNGPTRSPSPRRRPRRPAGASSSWSPTSRTWRGWTRP